jgi:hypothetical protein
MSKKNSNTLFTPLCASHAILSQFEKNSNKQIVKNYFAPMSSYKDGALEGC